MKLGFHSATTMTSSLETDIDISRQAGFSGLEVWGEKLFQFLDTHSVEELISLFAAHSMSPLAMDAIVSIGFRGDEFPQIQQQCRTWCNLARSIHCPTIVLVPGSTPHPQTTWAEIVQEYAGVLRDLSEIARPYGIRLAFEPLGFGWSAVRTPRGAWEIIQESGCDNIGLVLDAAHFYGGGGLLSELDDIDAARIYAFHLDDVTDLPKEGITDDARIYPGEGIIPLHDICARLKTIGYSGHCSVELFRPEYWMQEPLEVAIKTRSAAEKILSPYFSLD